MIAWLLETLSRVTAADADGARRPPARSPRCFGAGWAYALWLLPALRLVLPPLPQLAPDLPLPRRHRLHPGGGGNDRAPAGGAGPGQWVPFMLAMWAGGAVIFLLWHWLGLSRLPDRAEDQRAARRPAFLGGIRDPRPARRWTGRSRSA